MLARELYLGHADCQLIHSLVHLLHQLICHLLHHQHHLNRCTPLPTVAEPTLNSVHATCLMSF